HVDSASLRKEGETCVTHFSQVPFANALSRRQCRLKSGYCSRSLTSLIVAASNLLRFRATEGAFRLQPNIPRRARSRSHPGPTPMSAEGKEASSRVLQGEIIKMLATGGSQER